jgi:hypothetical protein
MSLASEETGDRTKGGEVRIRHQAVPGAMGKCDYFHSRSGSGFHSQKTAWSERPCANEAGRATRICKADATQTGAAIILPYSLDTFDRNLTLGQQQHHPVIQLRTPFTGINGVELFSKVRTCFPRQAAEPGHYVRWLPEELQW